MDERHARVKDVFLRALEVSEGERLAWLAEECGMDDALIAEVRSLMDHHTDAHFIDTKDQGGAPRPTVEPSEPLLREGFQVGEYVVQSHLGSGSFGTVYRGVQPVIQKPVAIKILHSKYSEDPKVISRFVTEARAVNKIAHDGIVDIFSFGQLEDGRHYCVMELLQGQTLREYLREVGRLSVEETVAILSPIADALHAANEAGIAHRDLKPGNIHLSRSTDGTHRAKLLDFGIAKLLDEQDPRIHHTGTGSALGTPAFMSPEQCKGEDVDHRADVYSFGVVAFQMLTGRLPFTGPNEFMVMAAHVNAPRPAAHEIEPSVPQAVSQVIQWLMARRPEQRPETIQQAMDALRNAAEGTSNAGALLDTVPDRPAVASVNSVDAPPRAPGTAKNRIVVPLVAALAVGALGIWWQTTPSVSAPGPAQTRSDPPAAVETEAPPPPPEVAEPEVPPVEAQSTQVRVELRGLPDGTSVSDEEGRLLEVRSGVFLLDRSDQVRSLVFSSSGFAERTVKITPDRDQVLSVSLDRLQKKKRIRKKRSGPKLNDLEPWE